jgi:hypothetical protein
MTAHVTIAKQTSVLQPKSVLIVKNIIVYLHVVIVTMNAIREKYTMKPRMNVSKIHVQKDTTLI